MWSEEVTGRPGLVTESYHRLGVYITAAAFLHPSGEPANSQSSVQQHVRTGLLSHITLRISSLKGTNIPALSSKMQQVGSLVRSPLKKVFYTVTLDECGEDDTPAVISLCNSRQVSCLCVGYQSSRERTVEALLRLKGVVETCSVSLQLGLYNCPEHELQWVMEHSQNVATVLNLREHNAPNLKMRQVDFAYSRMCNVMTYFDTDSSDDSRYDYIRALSEKYNRSPPLVLAKAMLQVGMIVMFNAECCEEFLEFEALSLCHPFTYRHLQLAPEKPKVFVLSDTDVQFILAASEVVESMDDEKHAASSSPTKRNLEFPKLSSD